MNVSDVWLLERAEKIAGELIEASRPRHAWHGPPFPRDAVVKVGKAAIRLQEALSEVRAAILPVQGPAPR